MSGYEPTEEQKRRLARMRESVARRDAIPPEQRQPLPRPDRFEGPPLGTDADGNLIDADADADGVPRHPR
jgi:hypothetical protein